MKNRGKGLAPITSNLRALLHILAPIAILAAVFMASQLPGSLSLFSTLQPETDATATVTGDCGLEWSIVSSPNFTDKVDNLRDLAIISENDIWAVGGYQGKPVTQHWDGNEWGVVPGPDDVQIRGELHRVSAVATDDVWAVGVGRDKTANKGALIEHWDGNSWRVVESPREGKDTYLQDVVAISENDVWAVGDDGQGMLAMHWNGSQWSIASNPNVPSIYSSLSAVAAVASNDVWAVGSYQDIDQTSGEHRSTTLVLHWNGEEWSIVASPNAGNFGNLLVGMAAISANDVWAVGSFGKSVTIPTPDKLIENRTALPVSNNPDKMIITQTLIEHWDGNAWSIVPNLETAFDSSLVGVTAVSSNNIWGVGYRYTENTDKSMDQLLAHWDGTSWSIVPGPHIGSWNQLQALASISPDIIWAVGIVSHEGSRAPLIARYSKTCATPVSTPLAETTVSVTPEVILTASVETAPTADTTLTPALSTPTLEVAFTPEIEVTVVTTLTPEATETSIVALPTVEVIGEVTSTPTLVVIQVPTLYPPVTPIDFPTIQVAP